MSAPDQPTTPVAKADARKRLPDESLRVTIGGRVYEPDPASWNWSHSEDDDAIHVALRLGGKCHLVAEPVEAKPDIGSWWPGEPIDLTLEYEARPIGKGASRYIRLVGGVWRYFTATTDGLFFDGEWPAEWEHRSLPAGCKWWSVDTVWVYAPKHPNATTHTTKVRPDDSLAARQARGRGCRRPAE